MIESNTNQTDEEVVSKDTVVADDFDYTCLAELPVQNSTISGIVDTKMQLYFINKQRIH